MTSKPNLVNDISVLTKVPKKILDELVTKANLCIGSAINDALEDKEEAVVINIGIGSLSISLADMQCKFIPSKDLKTTIKKCLATKIDPLELELEETLTEKLISIIEEVI